MTILKHKGILSHKGLLLQKGILYAQGLLPPGGFAGYYQWIIKGGISDIIQVGLDWFYDNFGTGGTAVRTQIKNTQILTIEAGIYMTFVDLDGATVVSNGGTAVPTKINDQRINFTAGTIWNLVLSNGSTLFCNDRTGVRIADYLGIHDGALIGANQAIAWGSFSDEAEPVMLTKGGGQYLDTITAGTSAILADPSGGNLGVEELNNGILADDITDGEIIFITDGVNTIGNSGGSTTLRPRILWDSLTIGNSYVIKGKPTINSGSGTYRFYDGAAYIKTDVQFEEFEIIFIAQSSNVFFTNDAQNNTFNVDWKLSLKEVTAIPAYGDIRFTIQGTGLTIQNINFFTNQIGISQEFDGYYLNIITNGRLGFIRSSVGSVALLFFTEVGYIDSSKTYQYKIQRNETLNQYFIGAVNAMRFEIKGGDFIDWTLIKPTGQSLSGGVYPSNPIVDATYTTTKFLVADNDAGDSIHAMSKDDIRYDPMHFVDGTGVTKVRNAIQVGTTRIDVDGNTIEFAAYCGFWNTGNTLNPNPNNDAGLIALWTNYLALNVLLGDNVTYDQLNGIDLTGIPKEDYTQEEKDGCILNVASEPYTYVLDEDGNYAMDDDGITRIIGIKQF